MALLNVDDLQPQPQQNPMMGLLNNPAFMIGLSLMAGGDDASIMPALAKMQEAQAINAYRQSQAAQAAQEFALNKKKHGLDEQKFKNEEAQQQRVLQGAQQLNQLYGKPSQNPEEVGAIFRPEVYEGSGYQGGKLTPEQFRMQAALAMAEMGKPDLAANLLNEVGQYGDIKPVMDGQGQLRLIQVDKAGNTKPVDSYQPIPTKGTSLTVGPGGQIQFTQGGYSIPGQTAPATSSTQTDLQKNIISTADQLSRLGQIKDDYQRDFLTYQGKFKTLTSRVLDKANLADSGQVKFLQQQTKFKNGVEQLFNQYRKEITGAAASVQELDRLKESMLNADMSPAEFEAAYEQFQSLISRSVQLKQQFLSQGVPINEIGQRIDEELFSGNQTAQTGVQTEAKRFRYNLQTGKLE